MEQKTDLRVQKTRKALVESLMQLLGERRFEDITVNELCERAMVRRATFYQHFSDKYDLFAYMIRELQRKFSEENEVNSDPHRPQTFYSGIFAYTLDFMEENEKMISRILKSDVLPLLLNILSEQIEIDVRQKLIEDEKRGAVLSESPDLLAPLFTGALVYTARWWISQKNRIPKDEVVRQLSDLAKRI